MKTHRNLDLLLAGFLAVVAFQFVYIWNSISPTYLQDVALSLEERPYVYRALLPILARALAQLTGIEPGQILLGLFVLSAVGLYFAVHYLYRAFSRESSRTRLVAVGCCLGLDLLIVVMPHVYDVAAAALFTLSLALLARGHLLWYLALFPVATLNRETTFLLLFFFLFYFFRRLPGRSYLAAGAYQVAAYGVIKVLVQQAFAHRPGVLFSWNVERNWISFINHPEIAMLVAAGLSIVLLLVLRRWHEKPPFLRAAFAVLFPLQVLLYLALGGFIEMRVFAESFPLWVLLALPVQPASTITTENEFASPASSPTKFMPRFPFLPRLYPDRDRGIHRGTLRRYSS